MRTLERTLFFLISFSLFLGGCKKEAPLVVSEEMPVDETESGEGIPEETLEFEAHVELEAVYVKSKKQQKQEHCSANFTLVNKMFKKIMVETYFQSALVGMPGVQHEGTTSRAGVSCPESALSDNTSYPTTMTLDYGAGCDPATGLTVAGVLIIDFSGPIDQPETTITLRPQDNFTISGYDIDISADNAVTLYTENGFAYEVTIAEGENMSMTDPDGSVTAVGQISPGNALLYDNNGTDSGPLDILDDTFFFIFDDMSISCGNGTQLTVAAQEELVYDLTCDCIQDGLISVFEGRNLVHTVDYGYPAEEGEEAICDDEILVITPVNERSPSEEVIQCP